MKVSENIKYQQLIKALVKKAADILPLGSQLSIYGSRARGDAKDESDWDLHILIKGDEKLSWDNWDKYAWPFSLVGTSFNETINPRIYSFSGWEKRSFLPFYKNVEKDKIIIFKN